MSRELGEADDHARRCALHALDQTQKTLDALRDATQSGEWRLAASHFMLLGQQAAMGAVGCRKLLAVKREAS